MQKVLFQNNKNGLTSNFKIYKTTKCNIINIYPSPS